MKKAGLLLGIMGLLVSCSTAPEKENTSSGSGKDSASHHRHGVAGGMQSVYGYADSVNDGLIATDTLKGSPRRTAMATISGAHIHIDYGSPGVKGRTIWGGLVAFDNVWAMGAHSATSISLSKAVQIAGKKIEPGTYAIFAIPGKSEWTLILNTNYEQHLADEYNEAQDIHRWKVVPEKVDTPTQRLTFAVKENAPGKGTITWNWELLRIAVPFEVLEN